MYFLGGPLYIIFYQNGFNLLVVTSALLESIQFKQEAQRNAKDVLRAPFVTGALIYHQKKVLKLLNPFEEP